MTPPVATVPAPSPGRAAVPVQDVQSHQPARLIPELNGLRGVAILLVFLAHFVSLYLVHARGVDADVYAVSRFGWTGVDLFFVLSGYLITGILLDTKGQLHYWRNYAAKRCLRIFPLYFGALFVVFVLGPLTHWSDPDYATLRANQAWYWTYLVNFLQIVKGRAATPLNTSHLWSLSIEEQFYVLWPFVVLFASRRRLLQLVGGVLVAGLLIRLPLVLGADPAQAYVFTPGRLDGLMIGAALAVVARAPGGLGQWRRVATQVGVTSGAVLLTLGVWRGMEYSDPVIALVGFPVIALMYGALLVLTLTSGGWWQRLMGSALLGRWGKYSYGLYLIHYPLLWALDDKLGRFFDSPALAIGHSRLPGVLLRIAVGVPLAFGLAWLSYEFYERRFLALKRYFTAERVHQAS